MSSQLKMEAAAAAQNGGFKPAHPQNAPLRIRGVGIVRKRTVQRDAAESGGKAAAVVRSQVMNKRVRVQGIKNVAKVIRHGNMQGIGTIPYGLEMESHTVYHQSNSYLVKSYLL